MKANNAQREARMRRQIQDIAASEILYHSKDPDLEFVTITEVKLTGDLQNATIFWTVYGGDKVVNAAHNALQRVTSRVRKALASKLGTRLAPTVKFEEDNLQQDVSSIEALLDKANHSDLELQKARENAQFQTGTEEGDAYKTKS